MYSKSFMVSFIVLMLIGTVSHSNDKVQQQLQKLNQVIKTAQDNHLNQNETSILVDAAIRGILKELDPHSYYFTKEEMKDIEARRSGNFFGVGITFTIINDTINILNVMKQGPASSAGLDVADKILKIDGESAIGISMSEVDHKLRGERNTYVTLDLLKANGKLQKEVNIVRSRIPVYSINSSYLIDDTEIGYIKISRFNATTHIELTDTLSILSQMGMKGLIIDLRGNPGGIVEQVYLVADEFVDENENILITKGRDPEYNETYKSTPSGDYKELPLILLIDGETASAPEILAGAFQDLDRSIVLGQTSFGKGLVQKPYRLADGSEFWLTVAKYYTPSGRSIQKDYSNKETYGTLKDRIVLKDGMNLGHTTELTPENGFSETTPIFRTKSGRPVLASGGIVPDYVINDDSITNLTKSMTTENIFNKYCLSYYIKNRKNIETLYRGNFRYYFESFQVDSVMIYDFIDVSIASGIVWDQDEFNTDQNFIILNIKAALAGIIWDENKRNEVMLTNSKHIKKAVELMPMAERIIHKN
ncbi:MAG: hypothetical protein CVV22_02640 [Ignavibacteriae bacterium HGW-Ignavibacteriae-1]|jgi:carboxyl-terminal processing protease|nr:MAG: hypothetical protein CVV22_02640 [Ignavibacteriae bacterium HGW-Ignavibacteriae-1]